ncbi:AAA family ATPase [Planomonospora sp. ID82291]|uniref:AAA family ATPase n=1 Tax=Planomonospora sp. ID82291 TaxID=2738136 RepID=UPI0018C38128|nr:AAA family ATPase [Planomonospora sp. ID82291]MBG0818989.1 AAA family ATPase [Planomonospora sp. ID82291]
MSQSSAPVQLNREEVEQQLAGLWNLLTPEDRELLQVIAAAVKANGEPIRITIGNLKGGVNKTTTAVFLALLLAFTGENVLLVDGDATNNSCLLWKLGAGENWPVNLQVMPWGTPDLAKRIKAMEGQFKHLVVDTGPQHKGVLESALYVTDTLLIPTQATPMDTSQLDETFALAEKIDAIKELATVVMFARAKKPGGKDTHLTRNSYARVEKKGYPVLSKPLYDSGVYAEAFPVFPTDWVQYPSLLAELVAFALDLDEVPTVGKK